MALGPVALPWALWWVVVQVLLVPTDAASEFSGIIGLPYILCSGVGLVLLLLRRVGLAWAAAMLPAGLLACIHATTLLLELITAEPAAVVPRPLQLDESSMAVLLLSSIAGLFCIACIALAALLMAGWSWWPRWLGRGSEGANVVYCRACGYNLEGLPRGSICPECGATEYRRR